MRLRSDEQLLAAFRAGHEAAFAAIHDRYRQRLFAYARQMLGGSRQDAEDVLQDVFLRAYATLRADGRAVALRPWLYRVAHNRCVDQMRRPAPAPVEIGEDTPWERPSASLHDPLETAQRREELARLVVDIRRLPEQQRSALLMREIDGMSYGELAGALEVSVPAVKSLLVRARMGLAEAGEARDAACGEIRADLAQSHDRGVRVSGHARRHLRDCDGCTRFRVALRATSAGMGALMPGGGPLAALAQTIGLGGAGSGAAAAVGGGGGMSAAWSAAAVTKLGALVGAAAIAAGGAGTVGERLGGGAAGGKHPVHDRTERTERGDAPAGSRGDPAGTGPEQGERSSAAAVAAGGPPAGRVSSRQGAEQRAGARRAGDRERGGKRVRSPRVAPPAPSPPALSGPAGLVPAVIGDLLGDSQEAPGSSPQPAPAGPEPEGAAGDQATEPAGAGGGGQGGSAPQSTRSAASGTAASDGAGPARP